MAKDLADRTNLRQLVQNGRIQIYSGTQPVSADTASNGTLLATITTSSGVFTAATLPQWQFTISGTSGSIDSVKVGGLEILGSTINFTTDLTTIAAAVASAINNFYSLVDYTATSSSATVTIVGPQNSGTALNPLTLTVTATTLVATPANSGSPTTSGVATVNGLLFTFPANASGYVSKSGTWTGTGVATGTAAWFRYLCDGADAGNSATTTYRRFDGSITIAGGSGDATLTNTAVTSGQSVTVSSFDMYIQQ